MTVTDFMANEISKTEAKNRLKLCDFSNKDLYPDTLKEIIDVIQTKKKEIDEQVSIKDTTSLKED